MFYIYQGYVRNVKVIRCENGMDVLSSNSSPFNSVATNTIGNFINQSFVFHSPTRSFNRGDLAILIFIVISLAERCRRTDMNSELFGVIPAALACKKRLRVR